MSFEIPEKGNWGGNNASGYSNLAYDAACRAALQALPGTLAYEQYHQQAQIIFSEELPAIPLFTWLRVTVTQAGVLDVLLDPTSPSELWNIEAFDVE
jgi:peptide/nickel transport system substrate-binding protein